MANAARRAHGGFLTAADSVLERIRAPVRDLLAPMGYSLLITGHSLGASTACLVARLLSAEMASWPAKLSLRCVAFAPCPCSLQQDSACVSQLVTEAWTQQMRPAVLLEGWRRLY